MSVFYDPNIILEMYKKIPAFQVITKTILPTAYNEGYTYHEVLARLNALVEMLIENENLEQENIEKLKNAFDILVEFINAYFDNLEVQEEINKKLDEMALDDQSVFTKLLRELIINNENPIVVGSTSGMTDPHKIYVLSPEMHIYFYNSETGNFETDGTVYGYTGGYTKTQIDKLFEIYYEHKDVSAELTHVSGYVAYDTGSYVPVAEGSTAIVTDFINVIPNTLYAFYGKSLSNSQALLYFYGANKEPLNPLEGYHKMSMSEPVDFETPSNCYYIRLSSTTDKGIHFYHIEPLSNLANDIKTFSAKLLEFSTDVAEFTQRITTEYKYIPFEVQMSDGGYYQCDTGKLESYLNSQYSPLIEVKPFESYLVTTSTNFLIAGVCYYDKDKKFLYADENSYTRNAPHTMSRTRIVIPSNCHYVAFSNLLTTSLDFALEQGVPFRFIDESFKEVLASVPTNKILYSSLYADGDSVAVGEGNNYVSYVDMIATDNLCEKLVKNAISGTTIAKRSGRTDSIYERISAVILNNNSYINAWNELHKKEQEKITPLDDNNLPDYIIIEGGFNDLFSVPRGSWGDVSEFWTENELITSTTCGALEKLFYNLRFKYPEKHPNKPQPHIIFVLPHKKADVKVSGQSISYLAKQYDLWGRLENVCKKWGIPCLNLATETTLCATTKEIANRYFFYSDTQGQGDGTHPNDEGYRKFYVKPITVKMNSFE